MPAVEIPLAALAPIYGCTYRRLAQIHAQGVNMTDADKVLAYLQTRRRTGKLFDRLSDPEQMRVVKDGIRGLAILIYADGKRQTGELN